jgi:hypothetical protein
VIAMPEKLRVFLATAFIAALDWGRVIVMNYFIQRQA